MVITGEDVPVFAYEITAENDFEENEIQAVEQEKLEEMSKEINAVAEPLRRFLKKFYDPMVKVIVETDRVVVERRGSRRK